MVDCESEYDERRKMRVVFLYFFLHIYILNIIIIILDCQLLAIFLQICFKIEIIMFKRHYIFNYLHFFTNQKIKIQ